MTNSKFKKKTIEGDVGCRIVSEIEILQSYYSPAADVRIINDIEGGDK